MSQMDVTIEQRQKRINELYEQLSYIRDETFTKKRDLIIQLRENYRPMVMSGVFPDVQLQDLCSFIGKELKERNIGYSSGHLAELFEDDEKRTQHRRNNSPDGGVLDSPPLETKREEEGIIGQIDYLEKQFGKSYDVMESDDGADRLQLYQNMASKLLSHFKTEDKIY